MRNPEGQIYCVGKDFRAKKDEQDDRQYGVPRMLNLAKHQVTQIALGRDHALLLASEVKLFAFGSNQYGQLGVADAFQTGNTGGPLDISQLKQTDIGEDNNNTQEAEDKEEFKERMRFLENFEHPITCEVTTFSSEPVPVVFNDQTNIE